MSNYKIEITDQKKFDANVIDVDVSGLTGSDSGAYANGTISIETVDGWRNYTGEHGQHDYEEEFGFILA